MKRADLLIAIPAVVMVFVSTLFMMIILQDEKLIGNKDGDERSQFVVNQEINIYMVSDNDVTYEVEKEVEKEEKPIVENETVNYSNELLQISKLSDEDIYYLKKIATCEAGGTDEETMSLVILVVLNRVNNPEFPNTVYDVITQKDGSSYQFSVCRPGGRWHYMEPNEKSDEAFDMVWKSLYDYSDGALYFESCKNKDNWHSKNLEYLYKSGGIRFYK